MLNTSQECYQVGRSTADLLNCFGSVALCSAAYRFYAVAGKDISLRPCPLIREALD